MWCWEYDRRLMSEVLMTTIFQVASSSFQAFQICSSVTIHSDSFIDGSLHEGKLDFHALDDRTLWTHGSNSAFTTDFYRVLLSSFRPSCSSVMTLTLPFIDGSILHGGFKLVTNFFPYPFKHMSSKILIFDCLLTRDDAAHPHNTTGNELYSKHSSS